MRILIAMMAILGMIGCSGGSYQPAKGGDISSETPVGVPASDGAVVKSRAIYLVTADNGQTTAFLLMNLILPQATAANPTTIPISYVSAPDVNMTVDSTNFSAGSVTSDILSLGHATITNLRDNNLRACGTSGNQKCSTAFIRVYTTGSAGAGLWNSAGSYGAPLRVGMGSNRSVVGLNSVNAVTVQSVTLPNNKNVVRDSDFSPQPMTYNFDVDMSNAGAGTYSTTVVVEYALAL